MGVLTNLEGGMPHRHVVVERESTVTRTPGELVDGDIFGGPQVPTPDTTKEASWIDQIQTSIVEFIAREGHKPHTAKFTVFKVPNHGGIGIQLQNHILADDDPIITQDVHLKLANDHLKDAGQKATWVLIGGGVYPSVDFGYWFPISGPS